MPRFPIPSAAVAAPLLALVVSSAGASAPPAEDVGAAVRAAWAPFAGDGVTIDVLQVPRLPAGIPEGAALVVDPPPLPLVAGIRPVAVSRVVAGRVVARGLVTVQVRREVPVWIVANDVAKGRIVTAEDLRRETHSFEREPSRELRTDFEPGRWTARRALVAGEVLRASDVARRPDVEAGATIRLVSRAGDARVSVPGVARRGGSVGETILVLNPLTGALVRAVIVEADAAELVPAATRARTGRVPEGETP